MAVGWVPKMCFRASLCALRLGRVFPECKRGSYPMFPVLLGDDSKIPARSSLLGVSERALSSQVIFPYIGLPAVSLST